MVIELPAISKLVNVLHDCTQSKDLSCARLLHAYLREYQLECHTVLASHLIIALIECGGFSDAQQLFCQLPQRSERSWTSLISGCVESGDSQHAFQLYHLMQRDHVEPSSFTFVTLLKAGAHDAALGRQLHVDIIKQGLDRDTFIGNTLVCMYGRHGLLLDACQLFHRLHDRDLVSWNALIAGYADHGLDTEALYCFTQMQHEGVSPNDVTFPCGLKACGALGASEKGQQFCVEITKMGFEKDVFVGSAIVDMYAKCGLLLEAHQVFDKLPFRGAVAWNALIAGYVEHGHSEDVLVCFQQMQLQGLPPDNFTFVCCLKACAAKGVLDTGLEIHNDVVKRGLEQGLYLANALIGMYGQCGSLSEAQGVFGKLIVRDIVSWTTMLQAYGDNHEGDMAIRCFKDMQDQGVKPNAMTFTCLLVACSQASFISKGLEYFQMMIEKYKIKPTLDHYACIIDLLARSGRVYEAMKLVEAAHCFPSEDILKTLLTACKMHGEVDLGLRCFQQLVEENQEDASAYLLMADVYASAGKWSNADRIEEMRKTSRARKLRGSASIEVKQRMQEFIVGNNQTQEVLGVLEILSSHIRKEGHMPNIDFVSSHLFNKEDEALL